jgi:hypothetical protein
MNLYQFIPKYSYIDEIRDKFKKTERGYLEKMKQKYLELKREKEAIISELTGILNRLSDIRRTLNVDMEAFNNDRNAIDQDWKTLSEGRKKSEKQ